MKETTSVKPHLELQVNIHRPFLQFEVKKHIIKYSLVSSTLSFLEEHLENKGEWPGVRESAPRPLSHS